MCYECNNYSTLKLKCQSQINNIHQRLRSSVICGWPLKKLNNFNVFRSRVIKLILETRQTLGAKRHLFISKYDKCSLQAACSDVKTQQRGSKETKFATCEGYISFNQDRLLLFGVVCKTGFGVSTFCKMNEIQGRRKRVGICQDIEIHIKHLIF